MAKIKRVRVRSDGGWLLATAVATHGWESVADALETTRQTVARWFDERVPDRPVVELAERRLKIPQGSWHLAPRSPEVEMLDRRGSRLTLPTPEPLPEELEAMGSRFSPPQNRPGPSAPPGAELPEDVAQEAAEEWDGTTMDEAGLAKRLAFEQLRRLARFRRQLSPLDPKQLELDARELPLLTKYATFAGELTANDHEKIVKSPAWRQIRFAIAKALAGRVPPEAFEAVAEELSAIEQSKIEQRGRGRPKREDEPPRAAE